MTEWAEEMAAIKKASVPKKTTAKAKKPAKKSKIPAQRHCFQGKEQIVCKEEDYTEGQIAGRQGGLDQVAEKGG